MSAPPSRPPLELGALVVRPDDALLSALRKLDETGLGVVLVCGEDKILDAILTDGDVRRFLLRGGQLDERVRAAANPHFYSVGPEVERSRAARDMIEQGYNAIPVVDEGGRLVHLHTLRENVLHGAIDSWAVVMAGGKGTRLGEFTQAIPKPMLPVGGRPILERIVRQLVSHGFRRVFISVNYLASMIEDHFGDGSGFHCRIEYLREERPLGTGGALTLLPDTPTSPLLVMNGDLLTNLNFSRLLRFHRRGGHRMTIALREHRVSVPYGVAELAGSTVARLVEKPSLEYQVNAGVYLVEPDLLGRIPSGEAFPITRLAEECLEQRETVGGYRMDESWIDIGLPEEYERAQENAPTTENS